MDVNKIQAKLTFALTIEERRRILHTHPCYENNIALWRSIKGRINEIQFERELRLLGYSRSEFNNTIQNINAISDLHIQERLIQKVQESFWFQELRAIIAHWQAREYDLLRLSHKSDITLATYFFVEWALDILIEKTNALAHITVDSNVFLQIRQNFYSELLNVAVKTLVHEFNTHKSAQDGQYTIVSFVEKKFGTWEDALAFYMEYPVLIRRLITKARHLLDALLILFDNLDTHYAGICDALSGIESDKLTSLNWGVGDAHAKSATVCILTFGDKRVVYKPHNSDVHKNYNQFLKWMNGNADLLPFYTTKDYFAESFSVCEFIEYIPCTSQEELERYYSRMGQHLALLFLIGGTDMHSENLIAMGEYPVIIDHETLFNNVHFRGEKEGWETVYDLLGQRVNESLVNTGILPMEIKGIEFGALAQRKQKQGMKRWVLTYQDDETISFEYQDIHVAEDNNIPRLDETAVDYLDYGDHILKGFRQTQLFFSNYLTELKHQIHLFTNTKFRIIVNATMHYADLYEYASHPKYMTDMLMLDKLFENIWNGDRGNMNFYVNELRDAHNCDIPIFHTLLDSTSLFASDGSEIKDFFDSTSLAHIEKRLEQLETEFEVETAILLKVLKRDEQHEQAYGITSLQRSDHIEKKDAASPFSAEELIIRVNQEIEKRLTIVNNTVSWLDLSEKKLIAVGDTHYSNGLSGLGLYLEHCKKANIPLSDSLEQTTEAISSMVIRKKFLAPLDILSAKSGVLSSIRFLLFKYLGTRDISLWGKIEGLLQYLNVSTPEKYPQKLASKNTLHVSSLIMLLFRLYQARPDYLILRLMSRLGSLFIQESYLYGLSHSELGDRFMAAALLAKVFPQKEEFISLYEFFRTFVRTPSAWSEKGFEQEPIKMGLEDGALQRLGSRLIAAGDMFEDSEYKVCLHHILDLIDQRKPCLTDTLSSGICADLDFLVNLYVMEQNPEIEEKMYQLVHRLALGYSINGSFRVKYAQALPSPGLYDGLAGVGYSILRYLDPALESPLSLT